MQNHKEELINKSNHDPSSKIGLLDYLVTQKVLENTLI